MPATYEPIATTTVSGGSTTSVTFNSIPSTYTDIVIIGLASVDTNAANLWLRLNGDSGTNYSCTRLFADGASVYSDRYTSISQLNIGIIGESSTAFTTHIINVQNYANATTNKTAIARSGYATGYVDSYVGLWRNTNAINSIQISSGQNFRSGSIFTIYGIKAA
jgi:hypothetical protein